MRLARATMISSLLGGLALLLGAAGFAADDKAAKPQAITPQETEFFETKVRPVLFERCFSCHGAKIQQGGLRLDSLANALKGGGNGPAILAGDPDKSALIKAIHYDGSVKMPPSGKLPAQEIEALTQWIKMGARWPGEKAGAGQAVPANSTADAKKTWWSFQPVKKPALPKVKTAAWAQSPIDRFVLAKLEAKGLAPAPPADRRTLLRRATMDLTGLPPTAEETEAFLADKSPDAWAKVVDRLLASPRYGERWGRHWLDVARYADTKGYVFTEDAVYHNAYTYRDYVIRSFNEDLPYDQFIIQQMAADRLPLGEDKRPLAALGFLTVGRRFLNDPVFINDDRIDVTTRGLMGLTVGCARCHNHKFDPIPTKDYYALYGVFASSVESNPSPAISPRSISEPYEAHNAKIRQTEAQKDTLIRTQMRLLRDRVMKTPDQIPAEVKNILQSIRLEVLPDPNQLAKLSPQFESAAQESIKQQQAMLSDLRKNVPPTPEFAMAMQDTPTPVEPHVFIRGNPGNQGEATPRQFLQILSGPDRKPFTNGSGRLELAQAIASKDNPLTARVLVNRVWMYHLGTPLVRTPGDFGTRGELPTHPELLDWLASAFTEETGKREEGREASKQEATSIENRKSKIENSYACGWSVKKLHRMILLSNTYQQSSAGTARAFGLDPENRLLSHQNRQRLDLEALRDSMLYVSGKMDAKIGGPAVEITTAPYSARRTVYGFIDRQNLQGLYRTFDFASPDASSAQRYRTTVPQQALFMMNSPFVVEQAKALLQRPELTSSMDSTQRIRALYRLVLGRAPAPDEIALGLRFLQGAEQFHATTVALKPAPPAGALAPWEQYAQTLLMTNEFGFVD